MSVPFSIIVACQYFVYMLHLVAVGGFVVVVDVGFVVLLLPLLLFSSSSHYSLSLCVSVFSFLLLLVVPLYLSFLLSLLLCVVSFLLLLVLLCSLSSRLHFFLFVCIVLISMILFLIGFLMFLRLSLCFVFIFPGLLNVSWRPSLEVFWNMF